MLKLIRPGSTVEIGPPQARMRGIVLQIWIQNGNQISYRVSWWDDKERRIDWFEECEVEQPDEIDQMEVEFRGDGDR